MFEAFSGRSLSRVRLEGLRQTLKRIQHRLGKDREETSYD